MKKALSILLALALALSLAVCAFAAKELPVQPGASKFQDFVPAQAAPGTQSLTFTLPTVTGISALWDGKTETLFDRWHGPYFGPNNVAITVSFAQGEPQELEYWSDYGRDWFWEILYSYDDATGEVTFYYWDSNFREAYIDTLRWGDYWNWDDLYATLPQASFSIPADLKEQYLKDLPKTELKLGESQRATLADGENKVYAFTPAKDGLYYFYSEKRGWTDPYAYLYDAEFNYIAYNDDFIGLDFGIIIALQAGKTYYLVVFNLRGDAGEFDVAVHGDVRKLNVGQAVIEILTGGIFQRHWYADYEDIYSFPGQGSWIDILKANLDFFRGNIRYNFFQSIIDFLYRIGDAIS